MEGGREGGREGNVPSFYPLSVSFSAFETSLVGGPFAGGVRALALPATTLEGEEGGWEGVW